MPVSLPVMTLPTSTGSEASLTSTPMAQPRITLSTSTGRLRSPTETPLSPESIISFSAMCTREVIRSTASFPDPTKRQPTTDPVE